MLISASTRRLVGGLFECRAAASIATDAAGEPIEAWQVMGEGIAEGRFEALHGPDITDLLGRDEELELLLRRWSKAKTGSSKVVLISGEPGIGKSRLTRAFRDAIAGETHSELRFFCSPHHQDSALYPIISQLERAAGFAPDDNHDAKRTKLASLLAQSNATEEAVGLIADLLSIPTDQRERLQQTSPQARRERTLVALVAHICGLAAQQPVLVIFEDIHWIDPTSREWLDRGIEQLERLPVLLLATFRPEFQPPWTGQANVTSLALTRLDRRDAATMIAAIAGRAALPAGIAREIAERTDGVPLFIEEVTRAVIEAGAGVANALSSAPPPALSVPATLHASLIARLDRLGPAAKDVAQKGAVIGREFAHELIAGIADLPEAELLKGLEQLTNSGLLFARGTPPQCTYLFKHALVQDAAYETLLRGRRQELHRKTAEALEARFPETVERQPELAKHFAEAGLTERSVEYWLKAGQEALARSAMIEAEALLRKGLNLVSSLPASVWRQERELDLLVVLGSVLSAVQSPGSLVALEIYSRARQLCQELSCSDKLLPILSGQWLYYYAVGELERAQLLALEMREFGETCNDLAMRFTACRASGLVCYFRGEFPAACSHLREGLAIYNPERRSSLAMAIAAVDPLVDVASILSVALATCGYLNEARALSEAVLAEARQLLLAPTFTLVFALGRACMVCWLVRSHTAGRHYADELMALAEAFPLFRARGLAYHSWCLAAAGFAKENIPLLTSTLADARTLERSLGDWNWGDSGTGAICDLPASGCVDRRRDDLATGQGVFAGFAGSDSCGRGRRTERVPSGQAVSGEHLLRLQGGLAAPTDR